MHCLRSRTFLVLGSFGFTPGVRSVIFRENSKTISLTRYIHSKMGSTGMPSARHGADAVPSGHAAGALAPVMASAAALDKGGDSPVVRRWDNISKSSEDNRVYRGLELKNRMKILIVSDPTTDKSAAAMDVNIGVMSDPVELPGLAHFCEHMLFMGTEKYPEENQYSKFLAENSGMSNAATSLDHTHYYFDVVPEKFAQALDIFAQFFIAPTFTSSATDREINAVDSEHNKNICQDSWRLDQLNRSTADPSHPFSRFGTGNKETLDIIPKQKGIDVRSELLKFHKKWYSSNIMTLCVLGKESLDELEAIVVEMFSQVQDRDTEAPHWEEPPFGPDRLATRATVLPVKDVRNLSVSFPMPDTRHHYKCAPGHYLAHLLGHEGPGSLLSALKKKGWCNSLFGGLQGGARGFAFFNVQVDLTEEGLEHADDIIKLVFQYINLLKKDEPKKSLFDESRDILAMIFRFKDKEEPGNFVSDYVHGLQEYPMEDILTAHHILTEWRPELVQELLHLLTPARVRVAVVARAVGDACSSVEPWYGTKYHLEKIPKETLESWENAGLCEELSLPPPNEFIPDSFVLAPRDLSAPEEPTIIRDTALMRVWHKQDDEFFLPKLFTTVDFNSPLVYADPLSCNLTSIFALLFRDALNEYAYAAELAGTSWQISNSKSGISLRLEGYDAKQHVLLEKIMECLASFKVDPRRFEVMKEINIRSFRNFRAEQPYQHGVYHLALLLTEHAWTKSDLQEAAEAMTVEKLEDFIPRLLSTIHVECLIHGNATKERALQLASLIEDKIPKTAVPLLPQQLLLEREIQLEKGSHYRYEVDHTVHKSSCTVLYYQCGMQSTEGNILLELLLQIISEPFFNILRTKEQLGYIVFSGIRRSNGVQGLRVLVQSERHPAYVETRVEAFFQHMKDYIRDMSDEELERHRASLAAQRLKRPKQLRGRMAILWSEIVSQQYHFGRTAVEVKALAGITRERLMEFYEKMIMISSEERQKLAVHVISSAEGGAAHPDTLDSHEDPAPSSTDPIQLLPVPDDPSKVVVIEDIINFKSGRSLFPHLAPFSSIPRKGAHCKL